MDRVPDDGDIVTIVFHADGTSSVDAHEEFEWWELAGRLRRAADLMDAGEFHAIADDLSELGEAG